MSETINDNTENPLPAIQLPGSAGEHLIQKQFDTEKKARAFYNKQVLNELAPLMCQFIETQEMVFVSTADKNGECDCSFRAGPSGFITVIDNKTILYPEYVGNGVMASMGNISENPNMGLLFIDFLGSAIGLHVNCKAKIISPEDYAKALYGSNNFFSEPNEQTSTPKVMCYILLEVEEAFIHCSKHIPLMKKLDKNIHWSTENEKYKGGDAFCVKKHPRPWVVE